MSVPLDFHLLKVGHCSHPECVTEQGGRWTPARFPALAALLIHPQRGPMLFDTGYSHAFLTATIPFPERLYRWATPFSLPAAETLIAQLAQHGYAPSDIRTIFVSHFHADHVAGLLDFPQARFFALRAEVDALRRQSRMEGLRHGFLRALLPPDFECRVTFADDSRGIQLADSMAPFTQGFDLLGDGSVTGIALPGHTAGQMGLLFRAMDGRDVFLVADACWSLDAVKRDRPPTWLASLLFADRRTYLETFLDVKRLLASHGDLLIVPSHCESSWKRISDEAR
jgi:glyoxylase-like metal-dependent hydrolase (beta-lactamase superfamily II)